VSYAKGTEVPVDRTQVQIRQLLRAAGAQSQGLVEQGAGDGASTCGVAFEMKNRRIRFTVGLAPTAKFLTDGNGRRRNQSAAEAAHQAEERRLWRALLLTLKARLEAVGSGIETFDEAFLAHVVMPDGQTVYESTRAAIGDAYRTGRIAGPLLALPEPKAAAPATRDVRVTPVDRS